MDPSASSRRVREIFECALELESPAAREAHVRQACGDDGVLVQRVRDLLEAHAAGESFLPGQPYSTPAALGTTEQLGDRIGRYRLLEKIGEGGCGVVYLAEQEEPVRRRVALKIIKPGMDSGQVIGRFEAEREALALMEHPSIAKFYDAGLVGSTARAEVRGQRSEIIDQRPEGAEGHGAGCQTPDAQPLTSDPGRPYFVMEPVRGIRITDYCAQKNLSTRERLDLFVQVCHAVQHAHQKGIIRTDLS